MCMPLAKELHHFVNKLHMIGGGGGGEGVQTSIQKCAPGMLRGFSNFGTFMGHKFAYFCRSLAILILIGCKLAICKISAILVY